MDEWERKSLRADALRRRGRWKEAIQAYNAALRANPCDTVSRDGYFSDLVGKLECLVRASRFAAAARCLEEMKAFRRAFTRSRP